VGKIEKVHGGSTMPLRLTRRKRRQLSPRRFIGPRVRVKCGCCNEAVDICHDDELRGVEVNTLEINGVNGTIAQWRKVFAPLLGFQEVRTSAGGNTKVTWESKID
jgi:hypothetical protein